MIDCPWCLQGHGEDHLCPPAREVLAQLRKQAMEGAAKYDMPTVEFTNSVGDAVEGILCKALAVRAFYTDTLQVYRPGIAIDPVMLDGTMVKPLVFIDDDVNIRRMGRLFDDTAEVAVRRARRAREEAFRR